MMWGEYGGAVHHGYGAGWIALMLVCIAIAGLIAALIAALVVLLVRSGRSTPETALPSPQGNEAELVLRRRFAAGEIDEDEFRRRRDILSEGGG